MADMNKIIDDIMLEAKQEADNIIAKAENDAEKTLAQAKAECAAIEKDEEIRRAKELSRLEKRFASSRASHSRTVLLQSKNDLLSAVTDEIYKEITTLSDAEYDDTVLKLLSSRMRKGECIIYFPPAYKPSEEFSDKLAVLAKEKNCIFTVSTDRKGIENGFVMVYGGIEENCTFRSLFEEKRDEISELAASVLFGTEEGV